MEIPFCDWLFDRLHENACCCRLPLTDYVIIHCAWNQSVDTAESDDIVRVSILQSKRESLNRHHEVCLFLLRPEAVRRLQMLLSHWLCYSQRFFRRLLSWQDFVHLQARYLLSFGCIPWLFGLSFHMERSFHARRRLRSNSPQLPWLRKLLSVEFYPGNSANTPYYF